MLKWDEKTVFLSRLSCFQSWPFALGHLKFRTLGASRGQSVGTYRSACCEPVAAELDSGARWHTLNAVSLAPVSFRATDSWWELKCGRS